MDELSRIFSGKYFFSSIAWNNYAPHASLVMFMLAASHKVLAFPFVEDKDIRLEDARPNGSERYAAQQSSKL
jgi:hypothetical protein